MSRSALILILGLLLLTRAAAAQPVSLQDYVSLGNYLGVRATFDAEANALIGAYVTGLSDGIYAQEMAQRRASGDRSLCFSGDNRRPTRSEALSILDNFAQRMVDSVGGDRDFEQLGAEDRLALTQRLEEVHAFPLLTVLQIAYQDRFACHSQMQ